MASFFEVLAQTLFGEAEESCEKCLNSQSVGRDLNL